MVFRDDKRSKSDKTLVVIPLGSAALRSGKGRPSRGTFLAQDAVPQGNPIHTNFSFVDPLIIPLTKSLHSSVLKSIATQAPSE